MLRWAAVAAALTASVALAGCAGETTTGETVTIRLRDVPPDNSTDRVIRCGGEMDLSIAFEGSDGGSITVQVREGNSVLIFSEDYRGVSADASEQLRGGTGLWVLTVHRSLEMDTPFAVMAAC